MAYNPNAEKIEQSAWNLSQHDIIIIGSLSDRVNNELLKGNAQKGFWNLKRIKVLINNDLKLKEEEVLNNLGSKIDNYHIWIIRYSNLIFELEDEYEDEDIDKVRKAKSKLNKLKHLHFAEVEKYELKIREYLGKYGYLMAKKPDDEDNIKF